MFNKAKAIMLMDCAGQTAALVDIDTDEWLDCISIYISVNGTVS